MAYITQSILEATVGPDVVAKLTRNSSSRLARSIRGAESRVESALQVGGYTSAVPSTVFNADASNCPDVITDLATRVWKRLAYAGTDLSIPQDQIRTIDQELLDIEEGRVEIKGVARSTARAPGGILGSDGDPNSSNKSDPRYRPKIFHRRAWQGW